MTSPIIRLRGGGSPADELSQQLRGFVSSGRLMPGERLPTVRQLARDLNLAPGTVAKVYRILEQDGLLRTRTRGGTFVCDNVPSLPGEVVQAARAFADVALAHGMSIDSSTTALRTLWPEP